MFLFKGKAEVSEYPSATNQDSKDCCNFGSVTVKFSAIDTTRCEAVLCT